MDFVNKMTGSGNSQTQGQTSNEQVQSTGSSGQQQSSGGFLGGIGDKLNSAAGGGRESEKNEDYLDKGELTSHTLQPFYYSHTLGVDFVQEKFLGQGPQDNEVCRHVKEEAVSANVETVRCGAGQGRADLGFHSRTVQVSHWL